MKALLALICQIRLLLFLLAINIEYLAVSKTEASTSPTHVALTQKNIFNSIKHPDDLKISDQWTVKYVT